MERKCGDQGSRVGRWIFGFCQAGQSAVWTDEAHFKAQLQIKVSGLHTLRQAVQVESAGNIWDETQREDMIPPEELEALELAEESAEHIETGYPVMGTGRDMGWSLWTCESCGKF